MDFIFCILDLSWFIKKELYIYIKPTSDSNRKQEFPSPSRGKGNNRKTRRSMVLEILKDIKDLHWPSHFDSSEKNQSGISTDHLTDIPPLIL